MPDPEQPALECDVVMKGGITSGIVYPRAILRMKDTYRFRNVGGTSAGAIAAAVTAAAEFGRATGGFARLERVPDEIAHRPMRAEEALELVGLKERMDHFPAQLSGGEQQRVAIARAIAKRPDLLLCDEPTGALDSATGVVVLEALTKVNAELGTTTLVITHNVAIRGIAHRVINFANGRIASIEANAHRLPASAISW